MLLFYLLVLVDVPVHEWRLGGVFPSVYVLDFVFKFHLDYKGVVFYSCADIVPLGLYVTDSYVWILCSPLSLDFLTL